MCRWWALRSPGCVRECSPGGHLNKEWAYSAPSAEAQLPMLFFLGREQNMVRRSAFFLQANRRVSLLHLYSWQRVSRTICSPIATDQSNSPKSWVLSLTGCNNKGPFFLHVCLPNNWGKHTFPHAEPRCTQTDDHSGGWAADSTILRLLPTFVSLTIRLGADRGAWFSHWVKRLCQMCSPSKCTGGPSWSQSSPINDGPISSSRDLWAGKWKAWRCSHLYNQCQGASDMDTPHLPAPHQPLWSDGDA